MLVSIVMSQFKATSKHYSIELAAIPVLPAQERIVEMNYDQIFLNHANSELVCCGHKTPAEHGVDHQYITLFKGTTRAKMDLCGVWIDSPDQAFAHFQPMLNLPNKISCVVSLIDGKIDIPCDFAVDRMVAGNWADWLMPRAASGRFMFGEICVTCNVYRTGTIDIGGIPPIMIAECVDALLTTIRPYSIAKA